MLNSFAKKELNTVLPMMAAFAAMSLASLHSVSLRIGEKFLEFALNSQYSTQWSPGEIADSFRIQMWMVFWVIALVFLQFSGTNALFAASLPIKRGKIILIRFLCGLCAFLPGIVLSAIYLIRLRGQNLDYLADSIAFWPENIHAALAASFSITAIISQGLLCILALTGMYTLCLLLNVVIRNRIAAAGVSLIAMFYVQLLLEAVLSAFYRFGINIGDKLWDFAVLICFPNLAENVFTRVSRYYDYAMSDELTMRLLPVLEVYNFDTAVFRLCAGSVIIALMVLAAVKLYKSQNSLTRRGFFVFGAVPVTLAVCITVFAAVSAVPMFKGQTEMNTPYKEAPLSQNIALLRLEEERFMDIRLDPHKRKLLEDLWERGSKLDSSSWNISLYANDAEQLEKHADTLEKSGITGFSEFIQDNKDNGGEDYLVYKDSTSDILIACRFGERNEISVYPNHIAEVPEDYAALTNTLRESGLFLFDIKTGGVMDELRFIDMDFFEKVLLQRGLDVENAKANEYIVYARNGDIEKIKTVSGSRSNSQKPGTEAADWFCRLAGFEYSESTTVHRTMYQRFYQWTFAETNLIR